MMLASATDVCTAVDQNTGDLCGNRYMGDKLQGMAAGMWSTMPEWARVGLCVIIAALLISAIMRLLSAVFARSIGVVVVIAAVVLLHNKLPMAYDWFRHLPFVNGTT
jgi:hypothetical protein